MNEQAPPFDLDGADPKTTAAVLKFLLKQNADREAEIKALDPEAYERVLKRATELTNTLAPLLERLDYIESRLPKLKFFRDNFVVGNLTSNGNGTFQWKEQHVKPLGNITTFTGGRTCSSYTTPEAMTEVNGWKYNGTASKALALAYDNASAAGYVYQIGVPPPGNYTQPYALIFNNNHSAMEWITPSTLTANSYISYQANSSSITFTTSSTCASS